MTSQKAKNFIGWDDRALREAFAINLDPGRF